MFVETGAMRGTAGRGLSRRVARHGIAGVALVLAATTACSGGGGPGGSGNPAAAGNGGGGASSAPASPTKPPAPPAKLTIAPRPGSKNLSPSTPISVAASGGTLTAVTLKNSTGNSWKAAEPLGYGKTYTLVATATNEDGKPTTAKSTFTTVTPGNFTMPSFGALESGGTFGVGMPVTVHFDEPIPNRAAAERALQVTTTPHVNGAWYWMDDQNVHYRGMQYWKPGTKITVAAKVYGVSMGDGLYGQADKSVSFTIGRSQVAIVNDATHMMTVYINGAKFKNIPVSMGRGGSINVNGRTIDFWTRSGPHVVMEKYAVKKMSSASYGLPVDSPLGYEEDIPLATRISGQGEFVHSAPWSVGDQGVRNVSHGCLNISPSNARWFYDTFRYGDIVDVRGTGHQLQPSDGLGDWTLSWTTWLKGSALR
jgi:lipoprotein-anchoring transpeptidase ErfK/SrfK